MGTSLLWVAIVVVSLLKQNLPKWLEELKTWAVAFVGTSFFIILHIDLEIPFTAEVWPWIVYAMVTLLQVIESSVVSRTVPMVCGAIGLFVISWKVAFELVQLADFDGGQLNMLALLAIVALQVIGIIVLAIAYAGRRSEVDDFVRAILTCKKPFAAKVNDEKDDLA